MPMNRAEIAALIAANLPDNTLRLITPSKLRAVCLALVASPLFPGDELVGGDGTDWAAAIAAAIEAAASAYATAAQGAKADTPTQPADLASAIPAAAYATAAQGTLADSAVQPAALASAIAAVASACATAAQGARADTATQPADLASAIAAAASAYATAAQDALADSAVQPARSIATSTGLTGGGDLSADRTLALSTGAQASLAKADSAVQPAALAAYAALTGAAFTGALSLGTAVAPGGANDLSRHLSLHTNGYGFCVTGSRLNYNAASTGQHDFYAGTTLIASYGPTIGAAFAGAGSFAGLLIASGSIKIAQAGTQPGLEFAQITNDVDTLAAGAFTTRFGRRSTAATKVTLGVYNPGGTTRRASLDSDGLILGDVGQIGDYFIGALEDGSINSLYLSNAAGAFQMRAGVASTATTYVFRSSGGTIVAQITAAGTAASAATAIITREKGDARFAPVSSGRFKPDAAPVEPVDLSGLALHGWTWGGDLDPTHPRFGRPGSGFIAEHVAEVLPSAVTHDAEGRIQGLDALALVAHAIGHFTREIAGLKARLAELESA